MYIMVNYINVTLINYHIDFLSKIRENQITTNQYQLYTSLCLTEFRAVNLKNNK